jgi:mono/diheme cytochrome c family protein
MNIGLLAAGFAATLLASIVNPPIAPVRGQSAAELARGRELVVYGSCNDCHTTGWRETDGAVAEKQWMTGSAIGFRGWWGTSYPANVRVEFQSMPEDRWIAAVRTRAGHPPMVWQDLRILPDADLRAIYQFVRSLGPAGGAVPAAVEPWRVPTTPFVDMRVLPSPRPQ